MDIQPDRAVFRPLNAGRIGRGLPQVMALAVFKIIALNRLLLVFRTVCFGSEADVTLLHRDVRSYPESGH
jgi:hypothetical protein